MGCLGIVSASARRGALALAGLALALAAGAQEPASPEPAPSFEQTSPQPVAPAPDWGPLKIADVVVNPGERLRSGVAASQSFAGVEVNAPFVVAHGVTPGPTLCITAGIHGDELGGIEIVRRVLVASDPNELAGTLIGVPIANPHGFRRSSRYLPDRRDLNRYFPGREYGSAASRIAHTLFEELIARCGALVDFHTGSFHRTNVPHLRADLNRPEVARLAKQFGLEIVVHNEGQPGTLRRAATDRGIPCVTYEAGEPMRLNEPDITAGVSGTLRLMHQLGMRVMRRPEVLPEQEVYGSTRWVRVDAGGILRSRTDLGKRVEAGERLGSVIDPGSNRRTAIHSPYAGRVIGMALDQVVIPGFAAYHLGIAGTPLESGAELEDDAAESSTPSERPAEADPEDHPEE